MAAPDPCLSVTELTRAIKALLEGAYPVARVRGEISNLKVQSSGHAYFSLKDAGASISCVCFRGDMARLSMRLRDGMQIVGTGRLTVYEPRGNYQIIFRTLEEDGMGRLQRQFEELKKRLDAEGLFDRDRKRALPRLAQTIGFVTSETGAALQDFISILRRRDWRGRLIVIPVRVQGTEAAPEIVRGIEIANRMAICDLLVIGRGGGSLEDLWPFNEESVARAVAASSIPIISAVGHEIDFTLSDFAADFRAETPSAAAEWITSARQTYVDKAESLHGRFEMAVGRQFERKRHFMAMAGAHLRAQHPRNRLQQAALRLDDLQNQLHQALTGAIKDRKQRLQLAQGRFKLLRPEIQIVQLRRHLHQIGLRLANSSHQSTLRRGYAILRSPAGAVISDTEQVPDGEDFTVELRDGSLKARRSADSSRPR